MAELNGMGGPARAVASAAALGIMLGCGPVPNVPAAPRPAPPAVSIPAPMSVPRNPICVDAPETPMTPEIRSEQRVWVRRTIAASRDRDIAAIVIDKAGYALHLYELGERTRSYPIQLGLDPVNDKVMEKDCRTPEGIYQIVGKLRPPQTTYRHALLLDYPNFHDYAEFITMRYRTLQIPLDAKIGDNIRIHGGGVDARGDAEEGWNWTKGCVALSDESMHDLAGRVLVGTPVAIVRELR